MTSHELLHILTHPEEATLSQVYELENIIHKYPYFQAGRAIHLKMLYAQKSYRYNAALKKTAAHIGSRTALFHFITSAYFKQLSVPALEQEINKMPHADYKEAVPEEFSSYVLDDVFEQIPLEENTAAQAQPPVDFSCNERDEFNHYLEIEPTPIDREETLQQEIKWQVQCALSSEQGVKGKETEVSQERVKKFDIIDKFLEANPKIEVRKDYPTSVTTVVQKEREIMTETLAKIYIEQAQYDEAIRAYNILILKNPERTRYFAEQISRIKELKQINKQD